MLIDIVRKIIPVGYRQSIGLWTAKQSGRSKLLLYPYFLTLCGAIPKDVELLPNEECSISYRGHRILAPRDGIFTSWEVLQDEEYEKVYSPLLGDTVVDIGAYVGMFTVKAALKVGPYGKVIAMEPAKSNLRYLWRNVEGFANVRVVPIAISSMTGECLLTLSSASPCHTLTRRRGCATDTVIVDTLDNVLFMLKIEQVNFIKIDAEGEELEILKGARRTLQNNQLKLAVAAYHNLPTGEEELTHIVKLLVSTGFKVTVMKGYVYAAN